MLTIMTLNINYKVREELHSMCDEKINCPSEPVKLLLIILFNFIVSPWKAPGQRGIADTHTLPPTDTALLQSRHS